MKKENFITLGILSLKNNVKAYWCVTNASVKLVEQVFTVIHNQRPFFTIRGIRKITDAELKKQLVNTNCLLIS